MSAATWRSVVRFGVPGMLAGLAFAWAMGLVPVGSLRAQTGPAVPAGGTGIIAFTTNGTGSTQLLYVIDTRNQALAIYRVDPQDAKGSLKLEATRHFRWDLSLGEFNNQPPEVATVESMVGALQR